MLNSRCGDWAVHLSPSLSFSFQHAYYILCITKHTLALVSSMHGLLVRVDKPSLCLRTTGAFPPLSNCLPSAHETQGQLPHMIKWLVLHTPFTFSKRLLDKNSKPVGNRVSHQTLLGPTCGRLAAHSIHPKLGEK